MLKMISFPRIINWGNNEQKFPHWFVPINCSIKNEKSFYLKVTLLMLFLLIYSYSSMILFAIFFSKNHTIRFFLG